MIFKTKYFDSKFSKTDLSNSDLVKVCNELKQGLKDARVGAHLYKKRVAPEGRGKSRSYRVILAAEINENYYFLYVFPKNKRANITKRELSALKKLSQVYLSMNAKQLKQLVLDGELIVVSDL